MIRLGMVGLNEGNGHPFSYSAIFNGYDPEALARRCPFPLIREYLPRDHRNEVLLPGARVTHVWTQERSLSEDVAAVACIPNVVERLEDLVGEVDAVILARDDPWNHLAMARPFLERRIPLFLDKQLVATPEELSSFLALAGDGYPWMAGSAARYTRDLQRAREQHCLAGVRSIHGMSRVSWMRYGHHLFEAVAVLFGLEIEWVRALSQRRDHDAVQISYVSGPQVILEFVNDVQLPIQFTCFSTLEPAFSVPFQDFFYSFREMLRAFVEMLEGGPAPIPEAEMLGIARVILAGDLSRGQGGRPFCPRTLEPL